MAGRLTRGYPALARPAFGIVMVMVLMMAVAGQFGVRIFDQLEQLHDSASRASAEAAAAEDVLDALQDSETAVRGYLLTMRPAYLTPYPRNKDRLTAALAQLDAEAADSPWLGDEVGVLRARSEARLADIDRTLAAARTAGPDAALAVMLTDQGRQAMDSVRAGCARILQHANAEREARTGMLMARERATLYLIVAAALAGMLLLGFAALGLLVSRARMIWAQAALSNQSGRLQATVDHIRDGVAVFDVADRLILWNPRFFPIAGLPATLAVPGTAFAGFSAAAAIWDPPLLADLTPIPGPVAASSEPPSREIRVGEKVLEVWRSRMPDGGHILVVTDITRRTHAEAIARQAQKMEALGQLTGGVAHDFNNLLQIVAANLELMEARLPPDPAQAGWLRARIAAARAGADRGARLVRHLLAFARRQPLAPQPTDPARLIRGMAEMLGRALGPQIQAQLVIPTDVWAVRVDPQQLENAVLNLAINGRDAIAAAAAGPPRLTITLSNVALAAAAAAQAGLEPGDYVRIAVADSGAGMSEATVARAVEPFFTTKAAEGGTGLGLPMVYGFARQSGGAMTIASAPGAGTTVSLMIPRTAIQPDSAPQSERPPPARPDPPAPRQTVLLAEDDQPVRATTAELLNGLGHEVIQAGTAAEALRLLDKRADVLMTDLGLPDMDGLDLARQALRDRPDLAVIVASGKAQADGQEDPRIVWLDKPYSVSRLSAAIARATALR